MNCINIKSSEYEELLEASKLPSLLLEMRIAKWQDKNGLESYPKLEDIIKTNYVNNKVAFKKIDNTKSINYSNETETEIELDSIIESNDEKIIESLNKFG